MATATAFPISMVSTPMSSQARSMRAMASRSSMPQLGPQAHTVSYSGHLETYWPFLSTNMPEQRITQPDMQPWVGFPFRSAVILLRVSPLTLSAPSNRPELKLRVGSPPASLMMLMRMSVP